MCSFLSKCLGIAVLFGAASALLLKEARNFTDVVDTYGGGPLSIHLLDLSPALNGEYFSWDLCDVDVTSNLGGLGPDYGGGSAGTLRFGSVGVYDGYTVDLLFYNTSAYEVHDSFRNTARGCFGVINLAKDSEVDLEFSFVKKDTFEQLYITSMFYFSLFDLDCSADGCESVEVSDKVEYFVDDLTELVIADGKPGNITFAGSTFGIGADNPPPLEALQLSRSVTFKMQHTSGGAFTFKVENSKMGRNFLFGGKTFVPEKETTTTTTLAGAAKCFNCIIWGDPHVITFDINQKRAGQHPLREAFFRTRGWKSDQVSIYEAGTFWLVNSKRVHIQGRYWHNKTQPDFTNLGSLAIGGPFLKDNKLIIRPTTDATTWNGNEILSTMPSHFQNEFIQASFHRQSEIIKDGKPGIGMDIELPEGVRLTVNRWKHNLAVKIHMCPQAGGQDGQCGNYNGMSADDVDSIMSSPSSQRVTETDFLF